MWSKVLICLPEFIQNQPNKKPKTIKQKNLPHQKKKQIKKKKKNLIVSATQNMNNWFWVQYNFCFFLEFSIFI